MRNIKLSVDVGESYSDPMRFVHCAQVAEKLGFELVWFGDHFMPWTHSRRRSAFVWSVMPVALERTSAIKVGPNVTCPIGGRFHPAIVAQSAATLDNMYPGRFMLGIGSGEAMNESRFLQSGWPRWRERIERLAEAAVLIRKLWESKEYFTFDGKYFKMRDVLLYTKPRKKIPIYFSALGKKSAEYAGTYGDHLVTINPPFTCRDIIFPKFETAARKAGKDPSKMHKMVHVPLYFGNKVRGVREIRESGEAGLLAEGAFEELDPRRIERMGFDVSDEKILEGKYFISKPDDVIECIDSYRKAGATRVNLVTQPSPGHIKFLGAKVLPHFREK